MTASDTAKECIQALYGGGSYEDIERKLAYIAVQEQHGFGDLRPVPDPMKPAMLGSWLAMSNQERNDFLNPKINRTNPNYWTEDEDGGKYFKKLRIARSETARNLEWLRKMKQIFEADQRQDLVDRVDRQLIMFDDGAPTPNVSWEE